MTVMRGSFSFTVTPSVVVAAGGVANGCATRAADPDADALRLTTVHQAKGLEYAAVFLIGLADGMFPLRRSIESGDVDSILSADGAESSADHDLAVWLLSNRNDAAVRIGVKRVD